MGLDMKADYEVAGVYSTFWGETQAEALKKVVAYLEEMPKIQLAGEDLTIQIVWSQRGSKGGNGWRFEASLVTYWSPNFVNQIKNREDIIEL